MWCRSFSLVVIPPCFHYALAQHKVNTTPPDTTRLPHPFLGAPSLSHSHTWVRNSKQDTTAWASSSEALRVGLMKRWLLSPLSCVVIMHYLRERQTRKCEKRNEIFPCRVAHLSGYTDFQETSYWRPALTLIVLMWRIRWAHNNARK